MKFLFDLFPVILFFGMYKWASGHDASAHALVNQLLGFDSASAPVMLATLVCMLGAALQIGYLLARRKKVDVMLWISVATIAVLGGLTIYFNNEDFIKWKPTIIYWIFACCLFAGQVVFKKNLMRELMEAQIKLPDAIWTRVGYAWISFLLLVGGLNLYVAFVLFKANTDAWVNFKLFGITGMFFVFIILQAMFLSKYLEEEA